MSSQDPRTVHHADQGGHTTPPPPPFSVVLSIDHQLFSRGTQIELTMTATSHAEQPITVFIWETILGSFSQSRGRFTCVDMDTQERIKFPTMSAGRRGPFDRRKRGKDYRNFITFEPGKPLTFTANFLPAAMLNTTGGPEKILPGQRYRYSVTEGETLPYWWYGPKEDVLTDRFVRFEDGVGGGPISLDFTNTIEFETGTGGSEQPC